MAQTSTTRDFRLSPTQEGMLFHHLREDDPGVDVEQIVCELGEELDVPAFERAWAAVAETHEALRLGFDWEDRERPVQQVHPETPVPFSHEDLSGLSPEEREARLEHFLMEDRRSGFQLDEPPLWRVALFRLGDRDYRCVWSFHHILLDGRSFHVVLEDLFDAYGDVRAGRDPELEAPRPFSDHVEWLENRDEEGAEAFWRRALSGFTAPVTPNLPEPSREDDDGEDAVRDGLPHGEARRRLSRSLTADLRELQSAGEFTLNNLVQGAWALLLSRYSGEDDVVFGAARACRHGSVEDAESMVGVFINTLPVRARIEPDRSVREWVEEIRDWHLSLRPHEHTPLVDIQRWSDVPAGSPLFRSILVYDRKTLDTTMREKGPEWENRRFELLEWTGYPLTLYGFGEDELLLKIAYDRDRFSDGVAERMLGHLETILAAFAGAPDQPLRSVSVLTEEERQREIVEWNDTERSFAHDRLIHELVEERAAESPEEVALTHGGRDLTYGELDVRAEAVAAELRGRGVGRDVLVGLSLERSPELVVGALGILKAGGAFLPLDPTYPQDRLSFILEDAGAPVLLTERGLQDQFPGYPGEVVLLDELESTLDAGSERATGEGAAPGDLAYVMYTSGSTGRPKGVAVEHRNVVNFFAGMDDRLDPGSPGVWLALTSLSFDISVLELLWTLSRGFQVILQGEEWDEKSAGGAPSAGIGTARDMDFGLFYFGSLADEEDPDPYRLLVEGAKFADRNGFSSVWTPERHFHAFGGLFPNPSVTGSALAALTENVGIRAGSVVLPLHHPARIVEEWSVVDNISDGRVGISFASGWQPDDFLLRPEGFEDKKEKMFEGIETVRELWRGEEVEFPGHDGEPVEVRTLPRPVQDELPVWVTSAGNVETYRRAGEAGAHLLTHLLGQSVDELAEKIEVYRRAREDAGHDPEAGVVSVMLHTLVGPDDDTVRELVREPMMSYLRSSVSLMKGYATEWTAYSRRAENAMEAHGDEFQNLPEEDLEALLEFAFERYFERQGLFGSVSRAVDTVGRLAEVGVDEVACLVDFGVDEEVVLTHLESLAEVRERVKRLAHGGADDRDEGVAAQIRRHGVSHVQCTPSQARMLLADDEVREALASVDTFLVGGEALPGPLARELDRAVGGRVLNMYGPTETTIWSSTQEVREEDYDEEIVPIGHPIANTRFYVLDPICRQPQPVGVAGELHIGGAGVVRGYLDRPELTADRFVADPFAGDQDARMYRTGDLVRYRENGNLDFLGRVDHQVKIRGHRIELGEIEAFLEARDDVKEAVAVARDFDDGARSELVAYVVTHGPDEPPSDDELRGFLAHRLPSVMVPSIFVNVDEVPLTPNGKVDRSALPEPRRERTAGAAEIVAPDSPLEERIAGIWREVLGLEEVSVTDNFFDLGGHSLLTVQVHNRLREELGAKLRLTELFRYPTVSALAEFLGEEGVDAGTSAAAEAAVDRAEKRRRALSGRRKHRMGS